MVLPGVPEFAWLTAITGAMTVASAPLPTANYVGLDAFTQVKSQDIVYAYVGGSGRDTVMFI